MDTATKGTEHSKTKLSKQMCVDGQKVPPGSYLRDGRRGRVYYVKITVGGKPRDFNSGILESMPGSREQIARLVEQERSRLLDQQPAKVKPVPAILQGPLPIDEVLVPSHVDAFSVGYACDLERTRFAEDHPGSPHIPTVDKHLIRICSFFGTETDVRTIWPRNIDEYVRYRRNQTTRRDESPLYKTIYREIAAFQRGVEKANINGYYHSEQFPNGYKLRVDTQRRRNLVKQDALYDKQKSKQFTKAECERWLDAAKDTRLEPYARLACLAGMRNGEIEALRWEWVHLTPGKQWYAEIRLPKELYIESRDVDGQPIILTRSLYEYIKNLSTKAEYGKPMLRPLSSAQRIANATRKKCGGELYITLRDLRASYARRMYEHTADVAFVMRCMRHKRIETTLLYLTQTDADMAKRAEAAIAVWGES